MHQRTPERFRQLTAVLLTLAALPCLPALGQGLPETPEEVAQQFTAAIRDTNWLGMASLLHPSALGQFHDLFAPFLRCESPDVAPVRQNLFGAASAAEVARMSDTVLMAAVFRFATTREQGLTAFLRTARMHVLGHVAEGPDTVHVLTRMSFLVETMPVSVIDVASFGRFGSTWRALLKADLSALAAMLRGLCERGG
jgi:hypothetical protein